MASVVRLLGFSSSMMKYRQNHLCFRGVYLSAIIRWSLGRRVPMGRYKLARVMALGIAYE